MKYRHNIKHKVHTIYYFKRVLTSLPKRKMHFIKVSEIVGKYMRSILSNLWKWKKKKDYYLIELSTHIDSRAKDITDFKLTTKNIWTIQLQ